MLPSGGHQTMGDVVEHCAVEEDRLLGLVLVFMLVVMNIVYSLVVPAVFSFEATRD